jgi:hypothetical protein
MALIVAILEDEASRREAMTVELTKRLPQCAVNFFDTAASMIEWLSENLRDVVLISLDHDLGASREVSGARVDPGIGREVSEFLATQLPICPIIVHSTNRSGAFAMKSQLAASGWPVTMVVPMNDIHWVSDDWGPAIIRFRDAGYVYE